MGLGPVGSRPVLGWVLVGVAGLLGLLVLLILGGAAIIGSQGTWRDAVVTTAVPDQKWDHSHCTYTLTGDTAPVDPAPRDCDTAAVGDEVEVFLSGGRVYSSPWDTALPMLMLGCVLAAVAAVAGAVGLYWADHPLMPRRQADLLRPRRPAPV